MKISNTALYSDISSTFLAELFSLLESGDFHNLDEDPSAENGEEVVGTMTNIERALYSLTCRYTDEYNALFRRLNGHGEPYSSTELPQLRKRIKICKCRQELTTVMMWNMIKERLVDIDIPSVSLLGIRSDFQIVIAPERYPIKHLIELMFPTRH